MDVSYYQPTGKVPILGLLLTCLGAVASAIVLAIIYIGLQWFNPFAYINFLTTIGFAYSLFFVVDLLCRWTKIRNRAIELLLVLLAVSCAYYVQWSLFISLMFNAGSEIAGIWVKSSFNWTTLQTFLLHPENNLEGMKELNAVGTFSLKDVKVSGWALTIVWIIEASTLFGYALYLAFSGISSKPFSEKDNSWMRKRSLEKAIAYVENKETLENQLKAGDFTSLQKTLDDDEMIDQYAQVYVYESFSDDHQYLSVDNHQFKINKKGEIKGETKNLVTHFKVPAGSL